MSGRKRVLFDTRSIADAVIATTALQLKASCFSNDPHLGKMKELHTRWV
ncbi:MAG: hypothetical protein ABSF00_07710 [Candidatus Bathyarchaeia archaeon]